LACAALIICSAAASVTVCFVRLMPPGATGVWAAALCWIATPAATATPAAALIRNASRREYGVEGIADTAVSFVLQMLRHPPLAD
jgi:hypothetical protein